MNLQLTQLRNIHKLRAWSLPLLPWRLASTLSSRPKAVTFDMGGVVVPTPATVFNQFEAKHGLPSGIITSAIIAGGQTGTSWVHLPPPQSNKRSQNKSWHSKSISSCFNELLGSWVIHGEIKYCIALCNSFIRIDLLLLFHSIFRRHTLNSQRTVCPGSFLCWLEIQFC